MANSVDPKQTSPASTLLAQTYLSKKIRNTVVQSQIDTGSSERITEPDSQCTSMFML